MDISLALLSHPAELLLWVFLVGVVLMIVLSFKLLAGQRIRWVPADPEPKPKARMSVAVMRSQADQIIADSSMTTVYELDPFIESFAAAIEDVESTADEDEQDRSRLAELQRIFWDLKDLQEKQWAAQRKKRAWASSNIIRPIVLTQRSAVNPLDKAARIILGLIGTAFISFCLLTWSFGGLFHNVTSRFTVPFVISVLLPVTLFSFFVIKGEKNNKKFLYSAGAAAIALALYLYFCGYNHHEVDFILMLLVLLIGFHYLIT
jgi:hypothetical protein